MKYVAKTLQETLSVTGIVNLHFFEFDNDFSTEGESHPFYELVFVNRGELLITSEDYTGPLKENQMIIHRMSSVHSLKCNSKNEPIVIIIGFECNSLHIEQFSNAPLTLNSKTIEILSQVVKEGRNVFMPPYNTPTYDMKKKENQPFGAEQMLKNLLESFLIQLTRDCLDLKGNTPDGPLPSLSINDLIKYVSDNHLEKMTIDELAFLFRTNRSTLCLEFKQKTGKTLVAFINEKKFELAKQKIIHTRDTFTKIAEDLNFHSIHYFTRFFKKMAGMTPKEFRIKHTQNSSL